MIQKDKLIQKIVKTAKISIAKATLAYETILKEDASFRKQAIRNVESKVEKAVKVEGKAQIKKIEVIKEVPVKMVNTIEKIKTVEVIKEVPIEVIKVVEKIKEVKVIKEVIVDRIKEVIKEVQVLKEVPIEVIKEITLIKEVQVPVEKIVEKRIEVKVPVVKEVKVIKEVFVKDEKSLQKLREVSSELAAWKTDYKTLYKQAKNYEKEIDSLNTKMKAKPREVIKEVKVPVEKIVEVKVPVQVIKEVKVPIVKEVKVPVIKEVKIKDEKSLQKLHAVSEELGAWKTDYNTLYKQATSYEKEIDALKKQLTAKPKEIIKKVPVEKIVEKKVEIKVRDEKEINRLKELLKLKPKEIIKTIVKEVPVEVIREVEVVRGIDMNQLKEMMSRMKTKEVSKTVVGETRSEKEAVIVTKREVKAGTNKVDDLTKIEGIGPKIATLLGRKQIFTFDQLANIKVTDIQKILDEAGSKFSVHDPKTWPQQSSLAAEGKWEELKVLQDKLIGGK